ncbi:MAG: dolichyl-phosphate beta-glucosyltransferase [Thermoguttaceae bacterium]
MPTESITLSLIIPAYNEAARLPPYLATVRTGLDAEYGPHYEVLVVDDGSDDGLADAMARLAPEWPQLRMLRHAQNRGKGAAVRSGMLAANGRLLLFADADGAAPIEEQGRLAEAIQAGADLAVGSRLLPASGVRRVRSAGRGLAGRLFAAVARRLLQLPLRDTQCGFKMFRAEVGRRLFAITRESRYLFDLELLTTARRLGYRIVEVPISWREVPGGHMNPLLELPSILVGLWRLRRLITTSCEPGGGQTVRPPARP